MSSDDDTVEDYSIEFDEEEGHTDISVDIVESEDESPVKTSPKTKTTKTKNTQNGTTPKLTKEKLNHVCRICLKQCRKDSKNASDFADTYLKCTGFAFEDDQGPKKLCCVCVSELIKVEHFIEKCSETEEKLSKGLFKVCDESESPDEKDFSDVSEFDVVIEGEEESSDGSNFSDKFKKKNTNKKVERRGRPRKEKPVKDPNAPKIERRGRPPLDPSQRKPKPPKGPPGRPKGSFKVKDENRVKKPTGRPKNTFKIKTDPDSKEKSDANEKPERVICFMCGKFVRAKQISYHIWKHRKDQEFDANTTETPPSRCEFCNKIYKTEEHLKGHMKRLHPAVAYGMPSPKDERADEEAVDEFDQEFHVPTPREPEYPQIQSPYNHVQALNYLQRDETR